MCAWRMSLRRTKSAIISRDGSNSNSNDPKFSDRQVWANTEDSIKTAQSDQDLHCLPSCLNLLDTLHYGKITLYKFSDNYSFGLSKFFRILWYSDQQCVSVFLFLQAQRSWMVVICILTWIRNLVINKTKQGLQAMFFACNTCDGSDRHHIILPLYQSVNTI